MTPVHQVIPSATPRDAVTGQAFAWRRLLAAWGYPGEIISEHVHPDLADQVVRLDKGDFVGRDALVSKREAEPTGPARRLRTVLIGGSDWAPIYGGEAVRIDGEVVGRLRSAAFGYTVGRTVGTTYLPAGVAEGTKIEVDVFADRVAGEVAADVLVDPSGARMRG